MAELAISGRLRSDESIKLLVSVVITRCAWPSAALYWQLSRRGFGKGSMAAVYVKSYATEDRHHTSFLDDHWPINCLQQQGRFTGLL